jgi:hypothetical protein
MDELSKLRWTIKTNLARWMVTPSLDSKEKIGKKTGVSVRTVHSLIAAEEHNATLKNLAKVAEAFGREPWEILVDAAPERLDLMRLVAAMTEDQAFRLKHLIMAIMGDCTDNTSMPRSKPSNAVKHAIHEPASTYKAEQ